MAAGRKALERWQVEDAKRLLGLFEAKAKMSQQKFGETYDIGSQGAVWQYLHGRIPLNLKNAMRFARGLHCGLEEISPTLAAHLESGAADDEEIGDRSAGFGVPVVGTAQLGDDGYWHELEYPVGHGEGFVRYPMKGTTGAYALRVRGDSMRPRIKPGEFVVIEPARAYNPGDEVMVQTVDGRSMIKTYASQRNGLIELTSVNEDQKPITFTVEQVAKVHYVGGIFKASMYYERET